MAKDDSTRVENKIKFYSLRKILATKCQYNVIFGERSNGKTYSVLDYGLSKYVKTGEQMAIIRRWQDDFKGKRGVAVFGGLIASGRIEKLTYDKWNKVIYTSGQYFLAKFDNNLQKDIIDERPFAFSFAISAQEHEKSTNYDGVTTILFDEFLTRGYYLPNEFVEFMNVLSTIIRYRDNIKIFMLGNTVNKYCPYFAEMGLTNIKNMKQGTIDVYNYGETNLKVAVEYCDSPNESKPSDSYFAFNNPKLAMITGGAWEIAIYPHCPIKYSTKDIVFTYFIKFDGSTLQCEIVNYSSKSINAIFTFIHRKTTEIKDETKDIIYTPEWSMLPNYKRKLIKPSSELEKKIAGFFAKDKVFYQDNEVGEIVRNYIEWCKKSIDFK